MKTSDAGVELIKGFEGLRLAAYRDPAGILTIGYGHAGQDVQESDTITEAEAERLLRLDLLSAELAVQRLVRVPLNQHQFDALVSFTYNVGAGNLGGSTLLRLLNDANYAHAAQQFDLWAYARGQRLAGLQRRRAAERFLFEQPMPAGTIGAVAPEQPPAPVESRTLPPYREEPAMPAPIVPIVSALVPALLPALIERIPALVGIFGDRAKPSREQYAAAGAQVLEIVTTATGARNAQEAVERISADPAAQQVAQEAVRGRWFDLQEVAGGIAAAREANAAAAPLAALGLKFHEGLTLALVTGAYVLGGAYLFTGQPAPEMAAALVTALVISALGAVVAYWFGSTSGSAIKSELLAKK
jgi:lysozyme